MLLLTTCLVLFSVALACFLLEVFLTLYLLMLAN